MRWKYCGSVSTDAWHIANIVWVSRNAATEPRSVTVGHREVDPRWCHAGLKGDGLRKVRAE